MCQNPSVINSLGFFIFLRQALNTIYKFSAEQLLGLSDLLSPTMIDECLKYTDVATIRKRRLPMELIVWTVVGMSLYRHLSMEKIVSQLDILLPGKKTLCCFECCYPS